MNSITGSIWNRTAAVATMFHAIGNNAAVVAKKLQAVANNCAPSIRKSAQSLFEKAKIQVPALRERARAQFTVRLASLRGKKLQKGVWWALGIIFVLQLYFVRELIAAEVIFGLGFAALLFLGGVIYFLGTLGERGLAWSEARARVVAQSARRGLNMVEELSRRSFRHPRSESAQ